MQPKPQLDSGTLRSLLAEAERTLAGGPHPERSRPDAELLLLDLLQQELPGRNRAWLIAHADSETAPGVEEELRVRIERRRAGEPVQYIVGRTEFYGLPFRVTRDVLIPRPETEHLVEKAIALAAQYERPRIVDVGTGSGAIAVALAHALPQARITAIDLSSGALDVARDNAMLNGTAANLRLLQGDLLAAVAGERFDLVVSNPPYVPGADRSSLAVEVREYEPELALFAGADGLDVYRRLIPAACAVLESGGRILLEIGYGQSPLVGALLESSGFTQIDFVPDLQSIPRVACALRR